MKVAYVFRSDMASTFQLTTMILPQLEEGFHGAEVVGMFFFDDNTYVLRSGDPIGERLAKVAKEQKILLMMCDQCAAQPRRRHVRTVREGRSHRERDRRGRHCRMLPTTL
jgi:hypothetical protein